MEENNLEQKNQNSNRAGLFFILSLIVLFLVLIGIWYWWQKTTQAIRQIEFQPVFVSPPLVSSPTPTSIIVEKETSDDQISEIEKDLDNLDSINLDQEFKEIDEDLNSL